MPEDDLGLLLAPVVADHGRIRRARAAAARLGAGGREGAINDAFLRLQLALVAGLAPRVRAERARLRALAGAA